MADPVILCLSRSGEATAHRIAAALGAKVHGREGRIDRADAFFANALDHARTLFASRTPIVGVCAAGILIRAVAPLLNDKRTEPPVIAVPDDGSTVIPLLGGHRGANRLAKRIAEALDTPAAVTTAGDVALGIALDEPPAGWRLANPEDAKEVMAGLLAGDSYFINGAPEWMGGLAELPNVSLGAWPQIKGPWTPPTLMTRMENGKPDWARPICCIRRSSSQSASAAHEAASRRNCKVS